MASTNLLGNQAAQLHFEVLDAGIGIAPAEQEQLFKAFAKMDASTTRKLGAMGIGLPNVTEMVKLVEGKVGASIAAGPDNTF